MERSGYGFEENQEIQKGHGGVNRSSRALRNTTVVECGMWNVEANRVVVIEGKDTS